MKADNHAFQKIMDNGWHLTEDLWNSLDSYSRQFMTDELTGFGSYEYYRQRIKAIGFSKKGKILDAACGNAQWAIVLAAMGNDVTGADINAETVGLAQRFVKLNSTANINIIQTGIDALPFENNSFDGIICYSAIMYTDYDKTLKGFNRVLKKGGQAYISTDSTGWLMHLLIDKGIRKFNLAATNKYLRRIYRKRKNEREGKTENVIITRSHFKNIIGRNGFKIIDMTSEGEIDTYDTPPPARYPKRYYGFEAIIDVLIEKI